MDIDQALAALAHLRTDLALTRDVLAQTQRAVDAERAARVRAEGERDAAQDIIDRVRWAVKNHYAPPPLCDALAAYDAAREG